MSKAGFTIKCNSCGNERVFTNNSKEWENESVCISVFMDGSYGEAKINTVDIDCYNPKCGAGIEIDY